MKGRRRTEQERLTREQSEELEDVLRDGFVVDGQLKPDALIPLTGIVNEPFWGAFALGGRRTGISRSVPDFVERLRNEGHSEAATAEKLRDYLVENTGELAQDWLKSNPFDFQIDGIKIFFQRQFRRFLEEKSKGNVENLDYLVSRDLDEFLSEEAHFSIHWFEVLILKEFFFRIHHCK